MNKLSQSVTFLKKEFLKNLKNARSVSLYSYNQSQILLNKLTLQNKLQNFVTNNVFLDKRVKTQQQK